MKIIFTMGLPASGKTTWSKQYCKDNPDCIRIGRDDLRHMRGTYWIPDQEPMIKAMETQCIKTALSYGFNVIIDATNLDLQKNGDRYREFKKEFPDLEVEIQPFDTDLEECILRDSKRDTPVGEEVIRNMARGSF